MYAHTITSRASELGKDMHISQEMVSQKEINNLLGSFYTTEKRFRNIVTAKDLVVCMILVVTTK